MECPQCHYQMSEHDTQCPRCQGKGLAAQPVGPAPTSPPYTPSVPGTAPDDAPSTGRAILSFFLPAIGGALYVIDRNTRPKRARSAGLGALIGCGAWVVALPVFLILAAILFPVFARARENARRASCQSNMKQLSLAVFQYTMDHKEQLPDLSTPAAIRASLGRYIKDPAVYTCPSGGQYVGNPQVHNAPISTVANPAQTPLLMETEGIHLDGHNVSFVDGHVKWFKVGRQ